MNRTLFIWLAIFFGLCFVSCSNQTKPNESDNQQSVADTKKIADLEKQITELRSATQQSAGDAQKITDLERQIATLTTRNSSNTYDSSDVMEDPGGYPDPNYSTIVSCTCDFFKNSTNRWASKTIEERGKNTKEAHEKAEDICQKHANRMNNVYEGSSMALIECSSRPAYTTFSYQRENGS